MEASLENQWFIRRVDLEGKKYQRSVIFENKDWDVSKLREDLKKVMKFSISNF